MHRAGIIKHKLTSWLVVKRQNFVVKLLILFRPPQLLEKGRLALGLVPLLYVLFVEGVEL